MIHLACLFYLGPNVKKTAIFRLNSANKHTFHCRQWGRHMV